MHVLTRPGVAIASLDKYHPALREHIETIKAMGNASEERHGLTWGHLLAGPDAWMNSLDAVVSEYSSRGTRQGLMHRQVSGVYSIPFLHPAYLTT